MVVAFWDRGTNSQIVKYYPKNRLSLHFCLLLPQDLE